MTSQSLRSGPPSVETSLTLSRLPAGQEALVRSLGGGQEFRRRAANLGFTVGASVRVVQNYGHGPVLVSLRGTLVALGRSEADKVTVSRGSPPGEGAGSFEPAGSGPAVEGSL